MANVSSNTEQKKSTSLPSRRRRGQIKAQIFESLTKKVGSTFSKVGEALIGMNRGGDEGNGGNSASSTPHPSAITPMLILTSPRDDEHQRAKTISSQF